ncbi:MAG: hypothetical protein ACLQBB_05100 [Solirubrobacteraceae bacterium]
MPTFCRHNRFIERCPICARTLPGNEPASSGAGRRTGARSASRGERGARRGRTEGLRVRHEGRAAEDGYRSELVPGLRASADAVRLAEEIAFSTARLAGLALEPPGLYAQARALAASDLERATWICFLLAYLSPAEGEDPFAGARAALEALPGPFELGGLDALDLDALPVGPRSSREPGRGAATLRAYAEWVARGGQAGGGAAPTAARSQEQAFTGDPGWSPTRRFERVFERLALPGFPGGGRFELLVTMGRLGLYELEPDSLHMGGARGGDDPATLAAKRVFGIGDPLLLERRAEVLADAAEVPLEALDLALFNWGSPHRATMGFPAEEADADAMAGVGEALGL